MCEVVSGVHALLLANMILRLALVDDIWLLVWVSEFGGGRSQRLRSYSERFLL